MTSTTLACRPSLMDQVWSGYRKHYYSVRASATTQATFLYTIWHGTSLRQVLELENRARLRRFHLAIKLVLALLDDQPFNQDTVPLPTKRDLLTSPLTRATFQSMVMHSSITINSEPPSRNAYLYADLACNTTDDTSLLVVGQEFVLQQ